MPLVVRALALTRGDFAARYRVPLGTLRRWAQGRSEPDQPWVAHTSRRIRSRCMRPSSGERIHAGKNRRHVCATRPPEGVSKPGRSALP